MQRGNRAEGYLGEQKAAEYLKQKGYRILERNFYSRYGEIDIIAREGKYLVFVEVKYRTNTSHGSPQEAVSRSKQRTICRVANYYCLKHGMQEGTACRFDVVAILGDDVTLLRNAFEYQC